MNYNFDYLMFVILLYNNSNSHKGEAAAGLGGRFTDE